MHVYIQLDHVQNLLSMNSRTLYELCHEFAFQYCFKSNINYNFKILYYLNRLMNLFGSYSSFSNLKF